MVSARLGGTAKGALGGAGTGAKLGSMIAPGVGTAIGAGLGGLVGGIGGYFGSKGKSKGGGLLNTPESLSEFNRFTPEQQNLISQLMGSLTGEAPTGGLLGSLLGGDALTAPYMRQFQEETIPGFAERFAGLGAGAQSSSAFQQALGKAGEGLSEKLAALQAQTQQGLLSPILSSVLAPQMDRYFQPSGPSAFSQGLGQGLGGLGQGVGQALPGILSNLFNKQGTDLSMNEMGTLQGQLARS